MKRITVGGVFGVGAIVGLVAGLGIAIGHSMKWAEASRNSSGTMSAISGPYVAGTVISAAVLNGRFADIETELTDSLDRSGKGGMLAALRGTDGTKAAPAFSWTSETGSGLYRNGSADVRMSVSATDVGKWTASGAIFPAGIAADTTINSGFKLGIGAAPTYPLDTMGTVGLVQARFTNSTNPPLFIYTGATNTTIGFNVRHDGANPKYDVSSFGNALQFETGAGELAYYTAASGTGGNTATLTERLRLGPSGTKFSTGIAVDGSGFKHQSVAGCATGAAVGATCDSTLTWSTTFADTSYQAYCSCNAATSGIPHIGRYTIAAGSILVATVAGTAAAAQCSLVTCLAVHN